MRTEAGALGLGNMVASADLDKRSFSGMLGVDGWLERVEKQVGLRK